MKNRKTGVLVVCTALLLLLLLAAAAYHQQSVPAPAANAAGNGEAPDYGAAGNWAYYALGEGKAVDLFLICPTVDMRDEFNMRLDDEETKASFLGALNMERGLYEESTRMFAPYYRQAAMKAYSLDPETREPYFALAYSDVSAAFSWYLEQENDGRPILLAGFSQGADMCYRLLEEYFGDEALQARLVAVYAIGWPCTCELTEKFPQIKAARGEDDVGVVVSFDCEAPEVEETFITPSGTKALTINPLNWRTDAEPVDKSANPGACFTNYSGEIKREEPGLCGCYIDETRGVVKVTDLDSADYPAIVPGLPDGAYHIYDYQFFFRALQRNVQTRIEKYFSQSALPEAEPAPMSGEIGTDAVSKTGNVTLSISCRDFLDAGYQYGDIVTLSFLDKALDIPFGNNYSDVDTGQAILVAREKDNNLKAAINMGDFATAYGIAVKTVHADETVSWRFPGNTEGPLSYTVSMKEPGGYYGEYVAHQLSYTDERSDYPGLSDEQFANFRAVKTRGVGENTLYRTASPVDPEHGRSSYADEALKNHGVTVIMDLVDDEATLTAFPGYEESYYHTVRHIALNTGMDFMAKDFREKLAKGLRFFSENPGVYAVHCQEGKARTGVVCALLECLMGAPLEEVTADYMVTFYNYYGVEPGDAKYDLISRGNVVKNLQKLFGTEDLESADLAACAEKFVKEIGLSDAELQSLKANLGEDHR